jgi:ribosomal protein L7Ae-like RNA K-turn-binding protein
VSEKWLNLLGLARRAGKVAPGENQTTLAMRRQTVSLLILAHDAGPSLYRKYHLWAHDLNVPLVRMGTKSLLGRAIGMGPHAVLAILDKEFGRRILEEMRKTSGGIFLDRKGKGQDQSVRTGQRIKAGQPPPDRSVASAKGGKHQKPHEYGRTGSGEDSARHHGGKTASGAQAGAETRATSNRTQSDRTGATRARQSPHRDRETPSSGRGTGQSQRAVPAARRAQSATQRSDDAPNRSQ